MLEQWKDAAFKALQIREQALNSLRAEAGQRVPDEEQRARYRYFRSNPQALVEFAARNVGPNRAAQEAERYMREMEKRYG